MSTRTDSNSSNEEEATEVVSVMSPTSASLEPGLKGVSSEKKGKGPKILQKLWQRKGTQLGSSPALATLTLSSTTTTNTTSTSQGRMISQSQQELPPPMSPGKNRKRILFRHSQTPQTTNGGGVATPSHSLFTSSSSSVTVSSSSPTPFSSSSSPSKKKKIHISITCILVYTYLGRVTHTFFLIYLSYLGCIVY